MALRSVDPLGQQLVAHRQQLDRQEAQWFADLADFDRHAGWASDGHLSCISWLVHFCGLARPTAKDKLRVALELSRRPLLAEAHARGELSYSKVRAMTRVVDTTAELDQILLTLARTG